MTGATGTSNARAWNTSATNVALINTYFNACLAARGTATVHSEDDDAGRYWGAAQVIHGPWMTTLKGPNAGVICDVDTSTTNANLKDASSWHPGGAQVSMLDAKVFMVSENVDQLVWIGAGSINGGETSQLR